MDEHARAFGLRNAGAKQGREGDGDGLDLEAEINEGVDADEAGARRRDARKDHVLLPDDHASGAANDEDQHARKQHRPEHQAQALENLRIGVVRLFPHAEHADRAVAVEREYVGERPEAVPVSGASLIERSESAFTAMRLVSARPRSPSLPTKASPNTRNTAATRTVPKPIVSRSSAARRRRRLHV